MHFDLYLYTSSSFFFNSSFSAQVILSSLVNLLMVPDESLKFYWTPLTSSLRAVFSADSFWIFSLKVSESALFSVILFFISLSYLWSLAWVALDNLMDSWAALTSYPRPTFSDANLLILFLSCSFSLSFISILCLYSLISFTILAFWLADNLKFYWADLISSSIA